MKRIIEGTTYNTETSTVVMRYSFSDPYDRDILVEVYQTRAGNFFGVHHAGSGREPSIETLSRDELAKVIAEAGKSFRNVEIIDEQAITPPPEDESEKSPSVSMFIRVPEGLRRRAQEAASEREQSVNAYVTRCLENCLTEREEIGQVLGEILNTAMTSGPFSPDEGAFSVAALMGMLDHIRDLAEDLGRKLGWSERDVSELAINAGIRAADGKGLYHWKPFENG